MAKAHKTLTDKTVENLPLPTEKPQEEYWDRLVPGFGVRVGAKGTKAFIFLTKVLNGGAWKSVRITLGRYPTLSLGNARELAREYSTIAAQGKDPRKAKATAKQEMISASRNTFGSIRDAFLEAGASKGISKSRKPWRPKTALNYKNCLSYFKHWDDLPIAEISRDMVQDEIDQLCEIGDHTAHNSRVGLNVLMGWCLRRGLIEFSPAEGVEGPIVGARERVLTDDELAAIWRACCDHGGPIADAFRVLILTGQRRDEIASLKWHEVDAEQSQITLSSERTKNARPHVIPLSALACSIIEAQPRLGEYVFTTNGKTASSGYSRTKRRVAEISKTNDWRLHDFRRTMVTGMNEMEIAPHVVEAIVNHVSGEAKRGVAGVYNKAQYMKARENALNAWSDKVEQLASGAPREGKVVKLGVSA